MEVFYSDEDNGNPAPRKAEIEDLFTGAGGEVSKERPREEVKIKKGRLASKKKSGKGKQAKPAEAMELQKDIEPLEI